MSTYPVAGWLEGPGYSVKVAPAPVLEPVATYRIAFEGFEGCTVVDTFEGTYSALLERCSALVHAGARNVRYVAPNGLEVQCRQRASRPALAYAPAIVHV